MTLTTLPRSELTTGVAGHCCGPDDASTVLLLHGVGLCLEAWEPQITALSKRYRVVAVDLPGHGGSAALPGEPCLQQYVDWAGKLIGSLDCGKAILIGHSMGALITLGVAVDYPELIERAVLMNAVYQRDAVARAAVVARAAEIRAGQATAEAPLGRWFNASEQQGYAYQLTASLLAQADAKGYADAYGAFATGDALYGSRLATVSCPLLALTADGDANSTPEMAQRLAREVPLGEAAVIEGHRHMVGLTAPDRVNDVIMNWLES